MPLKKALAENSLMSLQDMGLVMKNVLFRISKEKYCNCDGSSEWDQPIVQGSCDMHTHTSLVAKTFHFKASVLQMFACV